MKYFDHLRGRGGGGAIDPVVHARGCSPAAAIRWLAGLVPVPTPTAEAAVRAGPRPTAFVPPVPCARSWPRVRTWLVEERGLEAFRVDGLHGTGLLGADARGNAVFLCRDMRGWVTGAELVGTRRMADGRRFRGLAPGTRRSAGGFRIGPEETDPRRGFSGRKCDRRVVGPVPGRRRSGELLRVGSPAAPGGNRPDRGRDRVPLFHDPCWQLIWLSMRRTHGSMAEILDNHSRAGQACVRSRPASPVQGIPTMRPAHIARPKPGSSTAFRPSWAAILAEIPAWRAPQPRKQPVFGPKAEKMTQNPFATDSGAPVAPERFFGVFLP